MNLSIIIKIKYYDKHLDDCIRGLLSQNLKKCEIIFVSEKDDTHIDVFLLNILSKYSSYHNLIVVQEKNKNFNEILNNAIKIAKGKYIHILNQDTLVLENTYIEFFKIQEEFTYDLIVFDYVKIMEDISFSEVYKRYDKNILKIDKKNAYKNNKQYKSLRDSGLIFDFSKYSKNSHKNIVFKTKGFKHYSSNIFESIQRLDAKYKVEILSKLDIQTFNIIIKRELIRENLFVFPDSINTNIDIYKILPRIQSITCVKNTAITVYENKKVDNIKNISKENVQNINKDNTKLNDIIDQSKKMYKQIIDVYKFNPKIYSDSYELIEYFIILEYLNFTKYKHNLSLLDEQIYMKKTFEYLTNLLPNYKNNKFFNLNILKRLKINKKLKRLNQYLNQDLTKERKLEKAEKAKTQKEKIKIKTDKKDKREKRKIYKKDKKREKEEEKEKRVIFKKDKSVSKKEKVNIEEKKVSKESKDSKDSKDSKEKKKRNIFKIIIRKLSFDINRIKRTRLNTSLSKSFLKLKTKTKEIFFKLNNNIKLLFNKIFNKKKTENLKISKTKILLLEAGIFEESEIKSLLKEEDKSKDIEINKEIEDEENDEEQIELEIKEQKNQKIKSNKDEKKRETELIEK